MAEFLPGDVLGGRYEIIEEIGCGGMAEVYKAKDLRLYRFVAIKILKPEFRSDPEFVESFNIESQATASLSHKNIVAVYDIGKEKKDISYIVMEYVDGVTLKKYIEQNKPLSWQDSVDFALQICSALDHAHGHHVIHKDIKPHNIMVTEDKVLKVTDFGIAKTVSTSTVKISESTMGSVHYLSPEQARGGYVDEKSDIYSLGVVLYEMLTGRVPFDAGTPVSIALMHVEDTPKPVTEINPDIPALVEKIVDKAMSKEQAKRYQSAKAMLDDLQIAKNTAESLANISPPHFLNNNDSPTVRMDPVVPTKKDMGDNMSSNNLSKKEQKALKKKNKKPLTKADKIAIVAALLTAGLVIWAVYALAWPMVGSIFDGGTATEKNISVPAITGMTKAKAKLTVEKLNLEFEVEQQKYSDTVDKGKIISQHPLAGEKLAKNGKVKVVVSKGTKNSEMPDVVNSDRSSAVSQLEDLGLTVEVVEEEDNDYPDDTVIKQSPKAGSNIESGDKAILYVNEISESSTSKTTVPNLVGQSVSDALSTLEDSSLVLGTRVKQYSDTVDEGLIMKQSIAAGTSISKQSKINVTISLGPEPETKPSASPSASASSSPSTSSSQATPITKTITVKVPQDKDSTLITVKLDDETVYSQTVTKDKGSIPVSITGNAGETKKVSVYYDGTFVSSVEKSF